MSRTHPVRVAVRAIPRGRRRGVWKWMWRRNWSPPWPADGGRGRLQVLLAEVRLAGRMRANGFTEDQIKAELRRIYNYEP